MMTRRWLPAAVLGCLALVACGEQPQTQTTRKHDTSPTKGSVASAYVAPGWTPGDATSWEQQLKKRTQGQNEYARGATQ